MNTPKSVCYLSNDFPAHLHELPSDAILAPEMLLNGEQLTAWVAALKDEPKVFATCSLFILREMYMQGIPADFINLGVDPKPVQSMEDLRDIEILDRDLSQSERYMDFEMAAAVKKHGS